MGKCQDLKREIRKIWNCKRVTVIAVIIGVLGTISRNFKATVKKIGLDGSTSLLQNACLLGTAKILRKTLDTLGYRLQLDVQITETTLRTYLVNCQNNKVPWKEDKSRILEKNKGGKGCKGNMATVKERNAKRETKGMILAAQNQALRTKWM